MHEVNPSMYVARPELERELERSIRKNTHSLLFGESGNGKSWLYKTVLGKIDVPYVPINCGAVSQTNSITNQLRNVIVGSNIPTKIAYQESRTAEIGIGVAKADIEHTGEYQLSQEEPLYDVLRRYSENGKKKIIVLENLESIFACKPLLDELANILILLDDERYAVFNVNFLIVGTPTGVLEYFSKTKNLESVANRIEELPKVSSLSMGHVKKLIETGFSQLEIKITPSLAELVAFHTHDITLGVAQKVHEYLECLAYEIEDNGGRYDPPLLDRADNKWLLKGLRASYAVVQSHLNARETDVGRRNQVIYSIGKISGHSFDKAAIEDVIRREFPNTVRSSGMGIGPILSNLASAESPLLTRLAKGNEFSIADTRYLMCIRLILRKDATGKVIKRRFNNHNQD